MFLCIDSVLLPAGIVIDMETVSLKNLNMLTIITFPKYIIHKINS